MTEHRAWAPLRTRAFRALWIANLVSNVGTVMHTVGAGWAMTSLTASPAVVALAQVAWSVPGFLFALPAGALADLFDRRVVMRASQIVAMCIAALFGVLHLTGHLGVVALLAGTFLLSVSLTLSAPIFSAILLPISLPVLSTVLLTIFLPHIVGLRHAKIIPPATATLSLPIPTAMQRPRTAIE